MSCSSVWSWSQYTCVSVDDFSLCLCVPHISSSLCVTPQLLPSFNFPYFSWSSPLFPPLAFPSWLSFCLVSLLVPFPSSHPFFPHCLLFVFPLSSVIILLTFFYHPLLLSSTFLPSSIFRQLLHRRLYCCVLTAPSPLCFPSPSLLTMYIQSTALVLSPFIINVPLCLLLPETDSYLIFSLRQQLWLKWQACIALAVSTWMNTCKPQTRLHWRDTCCDWLNTTRCCSHPFYAHSLSLGCWSVLYW